jgi:hypothetical protein
VSSVRNKNYLKRKRFSFYSVYTHASSEFIKTNVAANIKYRKLIGHAVAMGEVRNANTILMRKYLWKRSLGRRRRDGRITLGWILEKQVMMRSGWKWLGIVSGSGLWYERRLTFGFYL